MSTTTPIDTVGVAIPAVAPVTSAPEKLEPNEPSKQNEANDSTVVQEEKQVVQNLKDATKKNEVLSPIPSSESPPEDKNDDKLNELKTADIQKKVSQDLESKDLVKSPPVNEKNPRTEEDKTLKEGKEVQDKNCESTHKEDYSAENNNSQGNSEQEDDSETPNSINIQELTEHVMNLLNDDLMAEVHTEQQLLKKNVDLQEFIVKLIRLLKEKTDLCANLDRQNSALISQAKSLKDVIAITKDLLGIRNMEIERLHADLTAMEDTIKEERTRHNLSVDRLNQAMSLNEKLKAEYLTQMDLFQKLRDKYNEKVLYLTKENQRLNGLLSPNGSMVENNKESSNTSESEPIQNSCGEE